MTTAVLEEFKGYISKSFKEIINDLAYEKITSIKNNLQSINDDEQEVQEEEAKEIITTEEELQGFYIVKSILGSAKVDLNDIFYKDTLSYFGILYRGKATKWICRLYLTNTKKSISFPNGQTYNLEKLEDIYNLKDEIMNAYESRK
ncbi:hypothetical protein [Helicobacter colisuis]|uniref:Restriction endonuclease n=1 Tax=Helicobacter colisuis TaxID=2949739 RepID=A0ABT0TU31_9HELI|nr:hypothetical protein [Helicobacter colisuis]MCL9819443.1 hypothetical protein [Helicobacter colisuis]